MRHRWGNRVGGPCRRAVLLHGIPTDSGNVGLPDQVTTTKNPRVTDLGVRMERVTRIELALSAWEARALHG